VLVADAELARATLGWKPAWSSLETMVETAHRWACRHIA
jgi:UDP-glucose 4-epimerase